MVTPIYDYCYVSPMPVWWPGNRPRLVSLVYRL